MCRDHKKAEGLYLRRWGGSDGNLPQKGGDLKVVLLCPHLKIKISLLAVYDERSSSCAATAGDYIELELERSSSPTSAPTDIPIRTPKPTPHINPHNPKTAGTRSISNSPTSTKAEGDAEKNNAAVRKNENRKSKSKNVRRSMERQPRDGRYSSPFSTQSESFSGSRSSGSSASSVARYTVLTPSYALAAPRTRVML